MIKCLECGKELRHKGALNGHLAFGHGIITPKQLTMDEMRSEVKELRSEVNKLRSEMDCFHRFFKLAPKDKNSGEKTDRLTAYDDFNENVMRLKEMPERSFVTKDGIIAVEAELMEM